MFINILYFHFFIFLAKQFPQPQTKSFMSSFISVLTSVLFFSDVFVSDLYLIFSFPFLFTTSCCAPFLSNFSCLTLLSCFFPFFMSFICYFCMYSNFQLHSHVTLFYHFLFDSHWGVSVDFYPMLSIFLYQVLVWCCCSHGSSLSPL